MFQLNEKVKNLTPYEPISGTYEIRLDANESFLTVPENIENEMVEALKNSALNRYPDPNATKLVKGFADYFNVDADCVTAGNGSDEVISVIMNAFLQKGDKILTLNLISQCIVSMLKLQSANVLDIRKMKISM